MPLIADYIYDAALAKFDTEATQLNICTQEPTTYTEAITTYSKGQKVGISIGVPADGAVNGRRVTVAAIADGAVNGDGTVTHYAVVDTVNSRLMAAGELAASQIVTDGNTFTLGAIDITIPDAVSA